MSTRGKSPREITKLLVWGRAAGRCQFENCGKPLDYDLLSGTFELNSAYLAHIVASSPNGKRGSEELSYKVSDKASNIMLMCDTHHRLIDGETTWRDYSVERLQEMKRSHEEWVDTVLSSGPDSRSHILQFSAPIGPNEVAVPFDDCVEAILPRYTPAQKAPIEIKVKGMHYKDSDLVYWTVQPDVLRNDFKHKIAGRFESGEIRHLSVFGLAPIPLLMELGRLLSDISDAEVFQRHREPAQWSWISRDTFTTFVTKPGPAGFKKVALKLCVTSDITDDRIHDTLGRDCSIWDLGSAIKGHDAIAGPEDLARFRSEVRSTLDAIKNQHGMDVELSVFPAVPVSCAIEFGRVWQPKAHPNFDVYDNTKEDGFVKRLKIKP